MHNFLSACAGVGLAIASVFNGHSAVKADVYSSIPAKVDSKINVAKVEEKWDKNHDEDRPEDKYEEDNHHTEVKADTSVATFVETEPVSVKAKSNLLLNVGL